MRVLFIHGGGDRAHVFDREIVRRLESAFGVEMPVECPHLDGLEHIEWAAAAPQLSAQFASLNPADVVVAHSIGGAAILKILTETSARSFRQLHLLAAPYKAHDSHWGIDDFSFANDFATRLPAGLSIAIHHSKDDEIIPIEDAHPYKEKMPSAQLNILEGYGHQFVGSLDFLARAIIGR